MRIVHTADLHLASPLTSRLSAARARERRRELLLGFRRLISEAEELGAEAMIIAGDLFDSEKVTSQDAEQLINAIRGSRMVFFYLPGNHEKEVLKTLVPQLPGNLKTFGEGWSYYRMGRLVIGGRTDTTESMFAEAAFERDERNIAILHGELTDRSGAGGKIGERDADGSNIDYLALGHYHTYTTARINPRCTAVYPGTPEGRGFDEAGEKGFVLIDIDDYGVKERFVPHKGRRLHIVDVDITFKKSGFEIESALKHRLSEISLDDLVRIRLTGERDPGERCDSELLERALSPGRYYLEIKDETRLRLNKDAYLNDRSLKGEFIRLVLSNEELSESEKEDIVECGLRALNGEEV